MCSIFESDDESTHVCLRHYFERDQLKVPKVLLKGLPHHSQNAQRDFAGEADILRRWNGLSVYKLVDTNTKLTSTSPPRLKQLVRLVVEPMSR